MMQKIAFPLGNYELVNKNLKILSIKNREMYGLRYSGKANAI
jgi:hypothetical protein